VRDDVSLWAVRHGNPGPLRGQAGGRSSDLAMLTEGGRTVSTAIALQIGLICLFIVGMLLWLHDQ